MWLALRQVTVPPLPPAAVAPFRVSKFDKQLKCVLSGTPIT
jgi:hypothetical protein